MSKSIKFLTYLEVLLRRPPHVLVLVADIYSKSPSSITTCLRLRFNTGKTTRVTNVCCSLLDIFPNSELFTVTETATATVTETCLKDLTRGKLKNVELRI